MLREKRACEFGCLIDKTELEEWEAKLQDRKQQLKDLYKNNQKLLSKPWLYNKKASLLHQEIGKLHRKIKFWKEELKQDQKDLDEVNFRLRIF